MVDATAGRLACPPEVRRQVERPADAGSGRPVGRSPCRQKRTLWQTPSTVEKELAVKALFRPRAGRDPREERRGWTATGCCLLAVALALLGLTRSPATAVRTAGERDSRPPAGKRTPSGDQELPVTPSVERAGLKQRLVGTWRREFFGEQQLTVRDDGTATVVAWPDGIWRVLLGARLEATFRWSLHGRTVTYHFLSGRPAFKIGVARKLWGDQFEQQVVTADSDHLVLQWADGDVDQWFRLKR